MKTEPWSDEESFKLIELVKKYGYGKWAEMAKQLPGRSNVEVHKHLEVLLIKDKNTNKIRFKNPKEVMEMSKPSSNNFQTDYLKKRYILNSAYETLSSALERIYYHLKEPITLENLSSISFPGLKMLQKELMKSKKKAVRCDINMNSKTRFHNMEAEICGNKNISDSENNTETNLKLANEVELNQTNSKISITNSFVHRKNKTLEEEEAEWVQKVLHSKFKEVANREVVPCDTDKIINNFSLSSTVEYSMYEDYLWQQMSFSKTPSIVLDDNMCIFNGHNYKTSLPEVLHHFVHPVATEDNVLVLPPNCATMDAMNEILESDSHLRNAANLLDHNVAYFRYLLNLTEKKPKCVHCSQAGNPETSYENYKAALDNMKSHLIVPTEEMKMSAMVETIFPAVGLKICHCDELLQSKVTVDLLSKRLIALFLWPYFLQSIEPRKHQTELLFRGRRYKSKMKPTSQQFQRGKKKRHVGCTKKKRPRKDLEETDKEDKLSCSSATTVQGSQRQLEAAQNEIEVISLSDTQEDFSCANPDEINYIWKN